MSTEAPPQKKPSLFFKFVKVVLLLIVLAILAIVGLGLFVLDGKYDVSREVVIHAPPAAVHKKVGNLEEWPKWLPFVKEDKSVKTTIKSPTGAGASQTWTSDHGNGELTFTESDEEKGTKWNMVFDKKYESEGSMTYTRDGENTKVVWRMTGHNKDFVGKWFAFLMPYMVGGAFERGLNDLKTEVEK